MAADVFAVQMVAALQAAILANPLALSVTVDGQTVTFASLAERQQQYNYWTKRVARANGSAPRSSQIYLGGFR